MRLKCPSTSSDESLVLRSEAKSMPKSRKVINALKNDTKPAHNQIQNKKKQQRVVDAIKKHRKQKRFHEPVHVFVGNFDRTVGEDNIQKHFSQCGRVLSVEIRCSGGLAMTTGRPDPAYIANYPVSQYAIVALTDEPTARKALELNGSCLRVGKQSSELVVSRTPADLPEVIDKVQQRLQEYRARQTFPDPRRARQSVMRALQFEPTIIVDTCRNKDPRKRMNLFGVSFAMPLF